MLFTISYCDILLSSRSRRSLTSCVFDLHRHPIPISNNGLIKPKSFLTAAVLIKWWYCIFIFFRNKLVNYYFFCAGVFVLGTTFKLHPFYIANPIEILKLLVQSDFSYIAFIATARGILVLELAGLGHFWLQTWFQKSIENDQLQIFVNQ